MAKVPDYPLREKYDDDRSIDRATVQQIVQGWQDHSTKIQMRLYYSMLFSFVRSRLIAPAISSALGRDIPP